MMESYSNIQQPTTEKTNSSAKQKILAGAMSLFLLGSTALGAEKKKTLDNIVEPAAKAEVAKPQSKNLSLTGIGINNDGYGNLNGEMTFGTFYTDRKAGFLVGLGVDFPKHGKLTSAIDESQVDYRIYDWERMGVIASVAALTGNPDRVIYGPVAGIGIQTGHVNSEVQNVGNMGLDEFMKIYRPTEQEKNKNSIFGKLGVKALIQVKGICYIVIDGGAKFGVKPTVQGNSYGNARIDPKGKITPYIGLGLNFEIPWKIGSPEHQ